MPASRFLAPKGGLRYEHRQRDEIARRITQIGFRYLIEFPDRALQRVTVANDPDALPHQAFYTLFYGGRDIVVPVAVGAFRAGGFTRNRQAGTVCGRRFTGARAENKPFEKRIRSEPVRAMHTRTADLARRIEPGHSASSPQVGANAAHAVMRGRRDRERLACQVKAVKLARRVDRRETGA